MTIFDEIKQKRPTFGPLSCKPMTPDPIMGYQHRVGDVAPDDGTPIIFHWHFQRGILQKRMSGLELAGFLLHHMPSIVPLLSDYPRVQREFQAMLMLLVMSPRAAIDRLLPWIRAVIAEEEDDVIHMSLFDKTEQPAGPSYFLLRSK